MPKPISCVLLIDDDPDDNFFHRLILEESGMCGTVRVAESGLAALQYLTETDDAAYERPDVIFLDINMPGMNGFEFLQHYQQLPDVQKSRLVLLMLTTSLSAADQQRAAQTGEVGGYYTKPLTTEIIAEVVRKHFG
jgi:CheY-like chemotaxis protein